MRSAGTGPFLFEGAALHTKLVPCYQLVGKKEQYGRASPTTAAVGVCGAYSFS